MKTGKEVFIMKKTYKIDVDCANCANKMEQAAKNTNGVKDATVNFMMLKMIVEFEEGADPKKVMKEVKVGKKYDKKAEEIAYQNYYCSTTYDYIELLTCGRMAAVRTLYDPVSCCGI